MSIKSVKSIPCLIKHKTEKKPVEHQIIERSNLYFRKSSSSKVQKHQVSSIIVHLPIQYELICNLISSSDIQYQLTARSLQKPIMTKTYVQKTPHAINRENETILNLISCLIAKCSNSLSNVKQLCRVKYTKFLVVELIINNFPEALYQGFQCPNGMKFLDFTLNFPD